MINLRKFFAHIKLAIIYLQLFITSPFSFTKNSKLSKLSKIMDILLFIKKSNLLVIFRLFFKIIAIFNFLLGFGVILAFNDFSITDPLIHLGEIYSSMMVSIKQWFKELIRTLIDKLSKLLDKPVIKDSTPVETPSPTQMPTQISTPDEIEAYKPYHTEHVLSQSKVTRWEEVTPNVPNMDNTRHWYTSPYFYVPVVVLIVGGGIIYLNFDSVSTYVVGTGLYTTISNYFGFNLPSSPPSPTTSSKELMDLQEAINKDLEFQNSLNKDINESLATPKPSTSKLDVNGIDIPDIVKNDRSGIWASESEARDDLNHYFGDSPITPTSPETLKPLPESMPSSPTGSTSSIDSNSTLGKGKGKA